MKFKLETKVIGAEKNGENIRVNVEGAKGGNAETVFISSCYSSINYALI